MISLNAAVVAQLKEDLALGCRILAMEGQEDITLGHVSARLPGSDVIYIKGRGLALAEVRPEDILAIDLEGRKLEGEREVHSEFPMHTEVYRIRPDVNCVIHTHPLYGTAFSSSGKGLEVLSHDGVLFPEGVPFFEETPELIVTGEQGESLARSLGKSLAIIIRNHGVLVVGISVPWAVLTALTLERALKMQALALQFGRPTPISRAIAHKMFPTKYNQRLTDEYWDYYKRKLRAAGLGLE